MREINCVFANESGFVNQPDSQKEPLGTNQKAWIKDHILNKNFRDKEDGPLVKCNVERVG